MILNFTYLNSSKFLTNNSYKINFNNYKRKITIKNKLITNSYNLKKKKQLQIEIKLILILLKFILKIIKYLEQNNHRKQASLEILDLRKILLLSRVKKLRKQLFR